MNHNNYNIFQLKVIILQQLACVALPRPTRNHFVLWAAAAAIYRLIYVNDFQIQKKNIFYIWSVIIYIYTNHGHRLNRAVMPKCYFSKFFLTFNMVIVYFHNLGWRKSRDLIWGLLIKIKEYASQVHPLSLSGLNQTLNFVLLQDFHFRQRSLEEEQRKGTSDITSAENRSTCDKLDHCLQIGQLFTHLDIVDSMKNGQHSQIFCPSVFC